MTPASPPSRWPDARRRYLVVLGLSGFAISQPLLSVLGDDPVTLAYHGVDGAELVLLCVLIAAVPPAVLCAAQAIASWGSAPAGRAVHLVTTAALAALFSIQISAQVGLDQRALVVLLSLVVGGAFAVLHVRHHVVGLWASYTAVLPVLAVIVFVAMSPASALLNTSQAAPDRIDPSGSADVPVVVVLLDELPTRSLVTDDGAIDATRFPNLARLSEDATWYRHHTAMATHTVASVPSMLSGTTPRDDPPLWTNYPDSLFTLLAPTHRLEVVESNTSLCPYTSCTPTRTTSAGQEEEIEVAGPGFADMLRLTREVWIDRITPGPQARSALDDFEEVVEPAPDLSTQSEPVPPGADIDTTEGGAELATTVRAEHLIQSFDADKGATLYFLHLMLPHQPFLREPDGELYSAADPFGLGVAPGDATQPYSWSEWIGTVSEQRHLLQAQYTDQLVGQIMDELRAEGMYDDALVVVTADHGISFETDTPSRMATRDTLDAIAYTPLLIKRPGQDTGVVDDTNVMGIDLVPTIADILELPVGWKVTGAHAGSPAVDARGGAKVMYVLDGFSKVSIKEVIEYDDADVYPTVGERWIGPLRDREHPLAGLDDRLDLDGVLHEDLDAVRSGSSDLVAQIDLLGDLETPPSSGAPMGLVTGRVRGAPDGARFVLALDGVIVGGSWFSTGSSGTDGHFAVLLPQDDLGGSHEVRAALVVDGGVRELAVESA